MINAMILVDALRDPASTEHMTIDEWTALLTIARAKRLDATLAHRLSRLTFTPHIDGMLDAARRDADADRTRALWEAEMARRALANLDAPVILLKGTAYAAAGLDAAVGRRIGDLDILVPRSSLPAVESALLDAGWEWLKSDSYDDAYYRRWMHELPPMMHRTRDRMIDVHHTILPLTARITPDADMLIADSVPLENGLRVLSPENMVCHAAAHLFADGDLSGGLRNLWDIDRLCREFSDAQDDFYLNLIETAHIHGLGAAVLRALRLSQRLFSTPLKGYSTPIRIHYEGSWPDTLFRHRLIARDGWGRETRRILRLGFYLRSHLIRMPLPMLVRHLWVKATRARE